MTLHASTLPPPSAGFSDNATETDAMVDLWNVPDALFSPDVITARVAEALQYAFVLLQQPRSGRVVVRKNLIRDLDINKDTLKLYISPVLDDEYRLVSGPTKIAVFHGIMHELGVRPSQLYAAAETSKSYHDFIQRITQIFLRDRGDKGRPHPQSAS